MTALGLCSTRYSASMLGFVPCKDNFDTCKLPCCSTSLYKPMPFHPNPDFLASLLQLLVVDTFSSIVKPSPLAFWKYKVLLWSSLPKHLIATTANPHPQPKSHHHQPKGPPKTPTSSLIDVKYSSGTHPRSPKLHTQKRELGKGNWFHMGEKRMGFRHRGGRKKRRDQGKEV